MLEPARRVSLKIAAQAAAILVCAAPVIAQAQPGELRVSRDEPRYAAMVMDATTGEVLYQVRADSPRYPASITKLMTFYLTFEALATGRLKEGELITVSPHAAAQPPTKLGLRPGETITVENAMHAMAVHSANDMAVALAERVGGSDSRFAAMMTMKAHELGMRNSNFVNPNGLPDSRHISSAHDITILCKALLRDFPQYYHYFGDEEFSYRGMVMRNTNHLLGAMPGVDGFKTGFTNAAGYNLAASAVRNGHRLIAVVLGGSSGGARNANVADLLLTGFDIEERRARGEKVLLAQNLFEPPPAPGYTPPRVEQGDVSDPIDVVLTSATHAGPVTIAPGAATQLSASHPSLVADLGARRAGFAAAQPTATPARAGERRNWRVQVGEYRSNGEATHQVDVIADTFKRLFDDREGQVAREGPLYRAIFTGFTESEARSACATVQAAGQPCAPSAGR